MVLEEHGYLSLSEHPELKKAVEWQVARGNLVRVLGNCYTDAHAADSLEVRVTAARLTYPNAVFLRETAARLSWWPEPLTVLDLTDVLGGAVIDEALRRSAVTLDDLHHALECTRGRRGNKERARLVAESRDEPWSELEIRGRRYCLDLAVPEMKLVAEVPAGRSASVDHRRLHRDRRRNAHRHASRRGGCSRSGRRPTRGRCCGSTSSCCPGR